MTDLVHELRAYGALKSQLVDLNSDQQPRVLNYLDLRSESSNWQRPIVVENNGRPCVHVFDGREGITADQLGYWCWRIALRGDGAWVGVVEPGRLRVFRADVSSENVRPIEVESTKRGQWALPRFLNDVSAGQDDVARRRYLTKLLENSARDATALGISQIDALSLVGRGLFWRFLVDRNLLKGLQPPDVCSSATTWEQCVDDKSRALETFRWLDTTFNGGLLPFKGNLDDFDQAIFSSVLGNIGHGATEIGQLRLPTDWQSVNFSYVPVGLLSEVYEAFAHNIDADEAVRNSIHYTPAHLADFVVTQALEQLPAGGRPKLLDPAAGAGVFLVTALRKLVEREWQGCGQRPRRQRIREILNEQLVGFDIDGRALRLAELALYLTALELDPDPRPLNELKFDALRDKVLYDFSSLKHGSLGPVEDRFLGKFDLVIGNPPWTAKSRGGKEKKVWVKHTRRVVRERLGEERAVAFDFPDTNMDLPFIWRAMEWAREGGRIALVTHARWLFGLSDRAVQTRNDLLEATRVTGVLNGSALRLTRVWPEVDAPWCVLFATNELPRPFDRAAFQFVSPALDTELDSRQARIRIDWLDANAVLTSEAVDVPWSLKSRFRGNRLAVRTLDTMRQRGERLGQYLNRMGDITIRNGYQIGGRVGKQLDASHMKGLPDTKKVQGLGFEINADTLPRFDRDTLLFPRDPGIYKAPLLLLRRAIPADRCKPRTHRSSSDIAFDATLSGISFARVANASSVSRYLQLVFQSSVYPFHEVLVDPQYGMFVDAIYLESVLLLPVVAFDRLSQDQRGSALQLSKRLEAGLTKELASEIDDFVFETFDLSKAERESIWDTLDTALPSTESKRKGVTPPNSDERQHFVSTLQDSLHSVLSASGLRARVRERSDLDATPWRVVEISISVSDKRSDIAVPFEAFLEEADTNGASLVVVRADETTWFVGLLDRYALWTATRARLLATDLIMERSAG